MHTTLFTCRARNISNGTPCINYKSELLWRSSDPKPGCIVTVEKEIIVEAHVGCGAEGGGGSVEMAA